MRKRREEKTYRQRTGGRRRDKQEVTHLRQVHSCSRLQRSQVEGRETQRRERLRSYSRTDRRTDGRPAGRRPPSRGSIMQRAVGWCQMHLGTAGQERSEVTEFKEGGRGRGREKQQGSHSSHHRMNHCFYTSVNVTIYLLSDQVELRLEIVPRHDCTTSCSKKSRFKVMLGMWGCFSGPRHAPTTPIINK